MRFPDFEKIISVPRMSRYVSATGGNSRKSMTLYRLNLRLSQELFSVVSCFEIALRNAIDQHYTEKKGPDWLRDAALPGGMYNVKNCGKTPYAILAALRRLIDYTPSKLLAEMEFSFWRYTFAQHQFYAGGQSLMAIFPAKPKSIVGLRYNQNYIFKELEKINNFRNRLAHHEPVCFAKGLAVIDTNSARQNYQRMLDLFKWMQINESELLYGIDHINGILDSIASLN
jgi:hypothetical protein